MTTTPIRRRSTQRQPITRPRLEAALAAARRGWPVFPLYPFSKRPAVKDWENRATRDEAEIAAWWEAAPYNVGVACGPAGLVVFDLDTVHGAPPPEDWADLDLTHGRDVLRILAERAGQPDPMDTYTVTSPGDSEHRYLEAPPGIELRNTAGAAGRGLGPYLDVRASGGYIVAAGSVRRINGKPRYYRISRDVPLAPLPQWLITPLTPPPLPEREPVRLSTGRRIGAYVQKALDEEADRVAHAGSGTRADITFKAAAKLGELVGAEVLDEAVAVEALLLAARVHVGVDRWTENEALHHIGNGIARGRNNPRVIDLSG
ncbi:bifunctional DNA primase/polymerase [Actinokineospora cianjurensis]|uniref:Bifunctional DNA primase/polymerase-like protein n=1 Tax=Actinokineospora cianjurensis TaxID=585224 RepID=A0A421B263_9PSEU|nr:bifunctional DNA primase/polymerase [Actinokineospora cianjurensis]RLK58447.1 bifunctional DNA primase/polymerase-like protein [Actinokineospora cianjurensis]